MNLVGVCCVLFHCYCCTKWEEGLPEAHLTHSHTDTDIQSVLIATLRQTEGKISSF